MSKSAEDLLYEAQVVIANVTAPHSVELAGARDRWLADYHAYLGVDPVSAANAAEESAAT